MAFSPFKPSDQRCPKVRGAVWPRRQPLSDGASPTPVLAFPMLIRHWSSRAVASTVACWRWLGKKWSWKSACGIMQNRVLHRRFQRCITRNSKREMS